MNTSYVGHNLFNTTGTATATATASAASSAATYSVAYCLEHPIICAENGVSAVNATIQGELDTLEAEIEAIANKISNDLADKLASELNIKQWYSLHLMDMCEGSYSPNATATGASKSSNMTCTNRTAMYHFDPVGSLNASLQSNSILKGINLTDIDWPDKLTDGLDALNGLSSATFVLYVLGIAFSGLAIITSALAFFLHGSRLISFGNWGIATTAFIFLGVASAIVTAIMVKVVDLVNKYGNDAGVYAYKGSKFLALTWAGTALMLVASLAWVVEFCVGRRRDRLIYTEKTRLTGSRGWKGRI